MFRLPAEVIVEGAIIALAVPRSEAPDDEPVPVVVVVVVKVTGTVTEGAAEFVPMVTVAV